MLPCVDHGYQRTVSICVCGVAVRIALGLMRLQPRLESAMELVVSSTSWERAQEGLFLGTLGVSHYAGGVFTGSPLMLAAAAFCATLPASVQVLGPTILFTAFDLTSALLLRAICVRTVAVESGDWETQLEEWMDDDAKPPGTCKWSSRTPASTPQTPTSAAKAVEDKAGASNTERQTHEDETSRETIKSDSTEGDSGWNLPDIVLATYLFNPVLAGQCVALSGDVLGRVLPLAALAAAGARRPTITAAALAGAACLWRFYAAPLLLPAALMLGRNSYQEGNNALLSPVGYGMGGERAGSRSGALPSAGNVDGMRGAQGGGGKEGVKRNKENEERQRWPQCTTSGSGTRGNGVGERDENYLIVGAGAANDSLAASFDPRYFEFDAKTFLGLCAAFLGWCAVVLGVCWVGMSGSWAFLGAAARGQLLCEDLTPNSGLYWYFFAEVFPRFRVFFRVLFLSQPYIYVLPATLRLGMFPEALATLLLVIFGLFQPYPTLADPMLAGCLFLCYPRTSARMRLVIPAGMVALVPSVLLPTMRHLWLKAGTGNANFYYFQTVVLNVLLSVLVLQFAAALVKRRKAVTVAFKNRRQAAAAVEAGGCAGGTEEEKETDK